MLNLEMFSNTGSYLGIIPVRAENENVIFYDLFPEVKYAQKEKDQIEQLFVNIGIALTGQEFQKKIFSESILVLAEIF